MAQGLASDTDKHKYLLELVLELMLVYYFIIQRPPIRSVKAYIIPLQSGNVKNHDEYTRDIVTTTSTTTIMTTRPTVTIATAEGKASGETHPLPLVFKAPIRPDIVQYEPRAHQS